MAENTKIEWADHTMNFWVGCTRLSAACDFCYAEGWAKRTGQAELWQGERRRTTDANWRKPLKWNAEAARLGIPYRVFTCSLADFFDNQADPEWRMDAWRLIRETPHLIWLVLTKRPQNIAKMLPPDWGEGYPNVWLGTTVENQEEADRRIPHLLEIPAKVHFLSCEPLLGPVDISQWLYPFKSCPDCPCPDPETDRSRIEDCCRDPELLPPQIDWVITGGESGPHARPSHPDWFRSLRDQCTLAGVPFLFKQWGEYAPGDPSSPSSLRSGWTTLSGKLPVKPFHELYPEHGAAFVDRIGKKAAGRHLDGVEHNELPKVSA